MHVAQSHRLGPPSLAGAGSSARVPSSSPSSFSRHAWRTYEIRPLLEWDGWAIWGTKARALYEFGGATGPVFTNDAYLPLQHPLLLPALEATDFRAMGAYDPTLVHVQLALLAVRLPARASSRCCAIGCRSLLVGATALAVARSAEPVLKQLSTNLADVPLALFVALGLVGVGRWLSTAERWPLDRGDALSRRGDAHEERGALLRARGDPCARRRSRGAVGASSAGQRSPLSRSCCRGASSSRCTACRSSSTASATPSRPATSRITPTASVRRSTACSTRSSERLGAARAALRSSLRDRGPGAPLRAGGLRRALDDQLAFAGLVLVYWISVIPIDLALVWSGDRTIVTARRRSRVAERAARRDRAQPRGSKRNTLNDGFFAPVRVIRPDCQPPRLGSSRSEEPEHHVDARVLARDRVTPASGTRACFAQETPKARSGGFVW